MKASSHVCHAVCLLLLLFALPGCGSCRAPDGPGGSPKGKGAARADIVVFAAASTTDALDEIKEQFQQQTGTSVQTNYAASSALSQQIVNGADADVFISADKAWADYVGINGQVAKSRDLLGNRLVIIVQAESEITLAKPEDLLTERIHHLALADPQSVPAGKYAKQALTKLGLWRQLEGKVVPAGDVRQALTYVATSAAEAGIVYATDAAASKSVKVVAEIPSDLSDPIVYPAVLLKHGSGNAAAEAFFQYLFSPQAEAVFRKHGFATPGKGE